MKRLEVCIHKGGTECRNHGGSGSSHHEKGYVHPYLTWPEMQKSYRTPSKEELFSTLRPRKIELSGLELEFDDDAAISMLGITLNESVSKGITDIVLLRKSFFDFDLVTEEGLVKFLSLLPVIDFEIIKEVMQAIWPAYPTDGLNLATARVELRGFLIDYLDQLSQEPFITDGPTDS